MKIVHWLVIAALAQSLAACGQKGPLVLPDAQRPHKKVTLPKAPASSPAAPSTTAPAPATAPPATTTPAGGGNADSAPQH